VGRGGWWVLTYRRHKHVSRVELFLVLSMATQMALCLVGFGTAREQPCGDPLWLLHALLHRKTCLPCLAMHVSSA
jgi:hypothetical protein